MVSSATYPAPRRHASIRQTLRAIFKRKHTDKLGTITSPTRSSSDLGPSVPRNTIQKSNRANPTKRNSKPKDLMIAKEFMSSGLMGLELEEGGLDDLKLSFEKGDDAYTLKSPRTTLKSPLSLEMPMSEDGDYEDLPMNPQDALGRLTQPEDEISDLPKAKKYEVKENSLVRPISRATANPAAENVSKTIETINKNKITRQPLTDLNSTNASKRNSVESKRLSLDGAKRQSMDTSKRNSVDASKRQSIEATKRQTIDHSKKTSVDLDKRPSSGLSKRNSVDVNMKHSVDSVTRRPESKDLELPRPLSMHPVEIRGGPSKPAAVIDSAAMPPPKTKRSSIQVRGGPQKPGAVLESAGFGRSGADLQSEAPKMAPIEIRGGPGKAAAVMESAGVTATTKAEQSTVNPLQIRGGPQKAIAVMESAGISHSRGPSTSTQSEQPVTSPIEIRGGPGKVNAVMDSARHTRDGSTSSRASNRHSIAGMTQLMEINDAASSKRMSHPPLTTRRSFSEGSEPANEETSAPLSRKPSGRKTAERLAWIRELEEGNKGNGNHGRDYMFNKLQGGVRDKLAKFENQQLTGGLARTNSNVSRRLSTNSDAYSIEQPALQRLSRTATIDDEFRKKLEESVGQQHESVSNQQQQKKKKKNTIPREVLDLVALSDGDQEAALNDFLQNWNHDDLIKQINWAADTGSQIDNGRLTNGTNENVPAKPQNAAKSKELTGSNADFDLFGPTVDLRLAKPMDKKPAGLMGPRQAELPKVPIVPTSGLPKISSWTSKPVLKSAPTHAANGAAILSMPSTTSTKSASGPEPRRAANGAIILSVPGEEPPNTKSSWNPKPNPIQKPEVAGPVEAVSKAPVSMLDTGTPKWNPKPSAKPDSTPKSENIKSTPDVSRPVSSVLDPSPTTTGSKWNPKPSTKPQSAPKTEEVKAVSEPTPAPKAEEMRDVPIAESTPVVSEAKTTPEETPLPAEVESKAIPQPKKSMPTTKEVSSSPVTSGLKTPSALLLNGSKASTTSPPCSPTKPSFTAAALPRFVRA